MKKQSEHKKSDSITEAHIKYTPYVHWFKGIKLVWVSFMLGGLLLIALVPLLVATLLAQCLLLFVYACISSGFIIALIKRGQKRSPHGKISK